MKNTPGPAGGPGGRDRTLAVKSRKMALKNKIYPPKNMFFLLISSSYAKILRGKIFTHRRFHEMGEK